MLSTELTQPHRFTDNVAAYKDSIKFVRGITEKDGKPESQVNNPDEIDIDMDDVNDTEADIEEGNTESIRPRAFYYILSHV